MDNLDTGLTLTVMTLAAAVFASYRGRGVKVRIAPMGTGFVVAPIIVSTAANASMARDTRVSFDGNGKACRNAPRLTDRSVGVGTGCGKVANSTSIAVPTLGTNRFNTGRIAVVLDRGFFTRRRDDGSRVRAAGRDKFGSGADSC